MLCGTEIKKCVPYCTMDDTVFEDLETRKESEMPGVTRKKEREKKVFYKY